MRAFVTVVALLVAAGSIAAAPKPRKVKKCVIAVASPGNQLSIDGVALPDYERATLEKVLGKPDRVKRVTSRQRYERWPVDRSQPPTSTMRTITDLHYVYDTYGLVFPTRRTSAYDRRETADRMFVFFANARQFTHTAPPATVPKRRGGCRLAINGITVDPATDARPAGLSYRTDKLDLFATKFAPTSYTTDVDGLYSLEGLRYIRLYLDAPTTGRPAYAEIR